MKKTPFEELMTKIGAGIARGTKKTVRKFSSKGREDNLKKHGLLPADAPSSFAPTVASGASFVGPPRSAMASPPVKAPKFSDLSTDLRIKAERGITPAKEAEMRAKGEKITDLRKPAKVEPDRPRVIPVPDGSNPDKPVRINKATGLPFGYSPGDALPANATDDMKMKASDSVARQKTAVNDPSKIYRGPIMTDRGIDRVKSPVMAASFRPSPSIDIDRAADRKRIDDRWAKENEKYARTDAAKAEGERRLKAEQAVREGGADAMSADQRKEFGKMYGDTKVYEGAGMTQRVTVAKPFDEMMKKRRSSSRSR